MARPSRPASLTANVAARAAQAGERGPVAALVPAGRVVELSASVAAGKLTLAVLFVLDAQRRGDPCAWVQPEGAGLFPPDLAAAGVALDRLVVVHAPRDAAAVARAAELLLRSGGFGLVVIDLTAGTPRGDAWVVRLGGLVRHHEARAVILTSQPSDGASAGALVALRVEPSRRRESGRYVISPTVLRDRCDLSRRVEPTAHRAPWEVLR